METLEIITNSARETKKVARLLAAEIVRLQTNSKRALVIALRGDLGGGKTTFTQGFARGLGIRQNILSPTFVMMKAYKIQGLKYKRLIHIDVYRLEKTRGIFVLGWKELVSNDTTIILVEWAERLGGLLPKERIDIEFEFIDEKIRKISIKKL